MKLLSSEVIRRCLIADPGYTMLSADFDQIELRIIGALAREPVLMKAAHEGVSLHLATANKLFGENHTPDQYKLTKNINFTWAFGGGADKMAAMYGISLVQARALIQQYENEMPALRDFKRREIAEVMRQALSPAEARAYRAIRNRMYNYRSDTVEGRKARKAAQIELDRLVHNKTAVVNNAFGRPLLVDAGRAYSVVNYKVQSAAADVLKQALLRVMADPELEPTVLLPIHDELLGQAPIKQAEYIARRYGEVMSTEFMGVPLTATGKVYGKSWGHGYRKQNQ